MTQVAIIGAGLGGLSCGAMLAKNGFQVLVLEQAQQPGGCLQCFHRKGVKFETGMHFVGSADKGQTLHRLLNYLEVNVQLSSLDKEAYEVISFNGSHYPFASGKQRFIERLAEIFPHQRENLCKLWQVIDEAASASSMHSLNNVTTDVAINTRYQLCSINEVVEQIITDPVLSQVVVGNLPLYAAERNKTPFSTYAFIMDFYNQSAYRVVGGSDHIAQQLIATIERYGGKVLVNKRVTHIDCENGRATQVNCADGTRYAADVFISDAHPMRTIELVDSSIFRPAFRQRITSLPNTVGGFAVYLHFREHTVPYMNYNFYGYRQSSPWGCERYQPTEWPKGYLYMHFCNEPNQRWARSGVMLSYMQMADVEKWKDTTVGHRGADYERFKQEHAEKLLSVAEADFPHLRDHLANYYTSTPLTYLDYTGTEGGSMYGIAKNITLGMASRVHHRTKIPNLFQTGQNINSHGILGVLVGSLVTCNELVTIKI